LGESIPVHCEVKMLNAFSAHGDRDKLIRWIGNNGAQPKKILLNHGDIDSAKALRDVLEKTGLNCEVAEYNKTFEI
jgi:metallo-beta-lactamase family protein